MGKDGIPFQVLVISTRKQYSKREREIERKPKEKSFIFNGKLFA